ncbi:hypothetical protein FRZ06_07435 [Anoxybacterium hadale]|uniref:Uncharacterized protein n=1 Tax=Anoxybacterium hadale TaxID=3408580 RepID=A0ACD1AHQ9_9FIRM|nr:hypothetical protein FRZ06_07435 [Clostridiales bacterium]
MQCTHPSFSPSLESLPLSNWNAYLYSYYFYMIYML